MKLFSSDFNNDCRGHGLIEFSLLVQLLVFLGLVGVDMGMALERYLTINNIAYEGSRLGAITPGEENVPLTVQTRVNLLMSLALHSTSQEEVPDNSKSIGTEIGSGGGGSVNFGIDVDLKLAQSGGNRTVKVRITNTYNPIIPFIDPINLSATVTAPYLAKE